ncbi:MAG: BON domain-containing protein [Desulfovibrionaceae bacterium]
MSLRCSAPRPAARVLASAPASPIPARLPARPTALLATLILSLSLALSLALAAAGCSPFGSGYAVPPDPRSAQELARDETLANLVQARFDDEFGPDALAITPYAYGGTIYLVGEYVSAERKDRAVELAVTAAGERPVKAYVMPRRPTPGCDADDNADLGRRVADALSAGPEEPDAGIQVATVQCTVVLLGLANSPENVAQAMDIAKHVDGVRRVTSFVRPYRPQP